MRTSLVALAIAAAVAAPFGALAQPGEGLSVKPESVPWARFQGRMSLATSTDGLLRHDLGRASEAPALRGMSLMGDYYLTGALLGDRHSGGLRATSALLIGPRWQTLGAGSLGLPGGGRGLIVERRLPATGYDGESNGALPYFGIGYTGLSSRGGFSWSADLGVVALNPGDSVRFGRSAVGNQNLDEVLREMRLQPMLQLGVSYSF